MSKRNANGWAGIVDVDDAPPPERTVVEPTTSPDTTPVDPRPGLTVEPRRSLTMPLPGAGAAARTADPGPPAALPRTDDLEPPALGAARRKPGGPAAPAAPSTSSFSGEAFIDRLGVATPAPARTGSKWTEYRELMLTVAIGLALVGGAIAWRLTRSTAPGPEPSPAPVVSPAATPSPTLAASPEPVAPASAPPSEAPVEAEDRGPVTVRSATPMLSIITEPAGADIEINGEFVGRSPFISVAPAGLGQIRVAASKEGYERAETVLAPNESGHLSTSLILVPAEGGRRRR